MELASREPQRPHEVPTQGIKSNRGGSLEKDMLGIGLLLTGQKLVVGRDKEGKNELCCHTPCSWGIDSCTGRVLESPTLRCVRQWGVEVMRDTMFPVFSRIGSAVAALIGLLTALTLFMLAVPMAAKQESTFDYIRVSTTSVGLVLALMDVAIVTMIQRPTISNFSCHICSTVKRHVKALQHQEDSFIQPVPTLFGAVINQPWPATWKTKLTQFMAKYSDVLRLIIIESLIYPSLVCDILEGALTHGRIFEGERLQTAHFVLTIFWHIVNVYIIRVIIVDSTINKLEKTQRGNEAIETLYHEDESINFFSWLDSECKDVKDCEEDKLPVPTAKSYACHGLPFLAYFFLHMMGQMIAQGVMLWAIWTKVECENTNDTVYISPFMWYMMIGAYVLPILGTLTFYISNYFWVQEFPVVFMLDLFKKRGISSFVTETVKDASEKSKIGKNSEWITTSYAKLKATKCFTRFFFPFTSPFLVFLSFLYSTALLTFIAFIFVGVRNGTYIMCHTIITIKNEPTSDVVMPPIGVSEILCLLMAAILIVLNINVLLIVGFWIMVTLAVALVLLAAAFIIVTDVSVVISVLVFVSSTFATMCLCVVVVALFGVGT